MQQKRVLAVHDISCFGRCSLTVALPILSAAGIMVPSLPTAVLSTHTGGFTGFTFHDLTGEITPITKHWKKEGIGFDAIYTGYLGSFEQIELVMKIFEDFPGLRFVDPVMADNGKLYSAFKPDFPQGMAQLCKKADVLIPNITEACLMLNEPYRESYDKAYIENLLAGLAELGPKKVVLTGVSLEEGKLGVAALDKTVSNEVQYAMNRRIPYYYHGTGDVFGSAMLAAMMNGRGLLESAAIGAEFTVGALLQSVEDDSDKRFGVNFESQLPKLIRRLGL